MKRIAVFLLLIGGDTALAGENPGATDGDPPPDVQVGSRVLIRTFAFGPVGIAGTTSEGEKYFYEVLLAQGAKGFVELFERGDSQAKAYALVGLKWFSDDRYAHLREIFVKEGTGVSTTEGCISTVLDVSAIADRIDTKEWDDHITSVAKKKKANQPSQPTRSARG